METNEKDNYELYKYIFNEEQYLKNIQEKNAKDAKLRARPYKSGYGNYYGYRPFLLDMYEPDIFKNKVAKYEEARIFLKNCGKPKTPIDRLNIVLMRIQQAENIEVGTCKN